MIQDLDPWAGIKVRLRRRAGSVPAQEQDDKHDDHDDHDDSEADKHGLLLSLSAGLTTVSQDGGRETRARQDGGPGWSVLEGVLDLSPGQLEVALGLVAAAFGL
jgi:hypothetical protein